jgi:hypothetical protein
MHIKSKSHDSEDFESGSLLTRRTVRSTLSQPLHPGAIHMNTLRVTLIAALLSSAFATAAVADTQATAPSSRADAQAQAAALLSRPHTSGAVKTDEVRSPSSSLVSTTADAQAQAAMLLNGVRPGRQVRAFPRVVEATDSRPSADAQAQAAALLSASRAFAHSQVQAERAQGDARTIEKSL